MSQIFSASEIQHLPQSVLSVKSKNGLNAASTAGSSPVLDFDLHGSIGYYLASDVVLSFDYEYTSTDGVAYNIRPQNNMGLGGIINQISIYSLQDGVLLEEIQDAHILNSVLMSHNNGSDQDVQDGTFKRMSVTECYTNDYQEITPFVSPNAQPATPTVSNAGNATYQSQKIQLPIRLSSLLNSDQVIPLGALGGLRIRFQLNPPSVFNMLHGDDVDGNVVALGSAANVFEIVNETIQFGDYFIYTSVNNTFTGTVAGVAVPSPMTMANYATLAALVVQINVQLDAMGQDVTCAVDAGNPTTRIVFTSTNAADVTLGGTFMEKMVTGTPASAGSPLVVTANTSSAALLVKTLAYTMPNFLGGGAALAVHLNTSLATLLDNGANDIVFTAPEFDADTQTWNATVDQTRGGVPAIVMGGTIVSDPASLFSSGLTLPAAAAAVNAVIMTARGSPALTTQLVLLHDSFYVNNPKSLNTCPFKIGTSLEGFDTAGVSLGVTPAITLMETVLAGVRLTFAADVPVAIRNSTAKVTMKTKIADESVIQYSMKNIALEVPVITPPPSYVLALQKAMNSAEGMKLDMKGYQLVRSNVQSGTTLASMNLPFVATRAKGIVSIPHVVGATKFTTRNVANNLDFLKISQYNYEYHGIKHPARSIDCNKARLGSLSQELIAEQHKSYDYCMPHKLLSFDGYKDLYKSKTFFLGRNLAIHNTTFNTINSNINLTIESTSTDGGAANAYNVNHYVSAIHSLVLRPEGVMLEK
jgi:hypothetical protein